MEAIQMEAIQMDAMMPEQSSMHICPTSSFSAPLVARRMSYHSGMGDTQKQDYLAQAERHIAIAENRIARQKTIIDELAQAGQETDCAASMLHALETCLHAFEQHRETIFERCEM
jgi:hypothetical protein